MADTILLIDALSLIHRAYHAYPPLTDKKGVPTGAVYGVTRIFLSVVNDLRPDYVLVAFDTKEPTFRHKVFEGYKAKRAKADEAMLVQIPVIRDFFEAAGGLILIQDGFEADDLIGSFIAQKKAGNNGRFIILSGDYDMAQLIDNDKVILHYTMGGVKNALHVNEAAFVEKWGFKPKLLVDYKALAGDPADNIAGVKGVGKKTAQILVSHIGPIEKIYELIEKHPDEIEKLTSKRVVELLRQGKESAFFSKELALIKTDVEIKIDLDEKNKFPYFSPEFIDLLEKYNFSSLLKMLNKKAAEEKAGDKKTEPKEVNGEQLGLF
ncbi:MAG: hypothetical protein GXP43_00845 [bacterium]|nr:hypothetical protein [bacterium]